MAPTPAPATGGEQSHKEKRVKYRILKDKCVQCGKCEDICPADAIQDYEVDQEKCLGCGACAQVCDVEAVVPVDE